MGSYERAARRRLRQDRDDGIARGVAPAARYRGYVVQALHTPEPGGDDHVTLRLGVGPDGRDPVAELELCSHGLDLFVSDLRLAVAEAELHGHAVVAAGHLLSSWIEGGPDGTT